MPSRLQARLWPRHRQFERAEARVHALHFGDQLVDRDGVSEGAAVARDIGAGEPDLVAVVVFAEPVRVVQAADRRDVRAVPPEGAHRVGQLVTGAGFLDLPGERVDAVRDVEEHAALRPGGGLRRSGGRRARRAHAIEHRQRHARPQPPQCGAAADVPFVGVDIAHGGIRKEPRTDADSHGLLMGSRHVDNRGRPLRAQVKFLVAKLVRVSSRRASKLLRVRLRDELGYLLAQSVSIRANPRSATSCGTSPRRRRPRRCRAAGSRLRGRSRRALRDRRGRRR